MKAPHRVRPAEPADSAAWVAMRHDLWPDETDTHASEAVRYFAGDRAGSLPEMVLVALDGGSGAPVGFAELTRRSVAEGCLTSPVAFLEGWYVVSTHRGEGVGRLLMAAAEAWGRAVGCREFGSNADVENLASAAAHRALGFEDLGVIRSFRKDLL